MIICYDKHARLEAGGVTYTIPLVAPPIPPLLLPLRGARGRGRLDGHAHTPTSTHTIDTHRIRLR